jgi:hypothetical protein
LNVSGIATLANVSVTGAILSQLTVSGVSTLGNVTATQLNLSGVGTITTLNSTTANLTNISGTNLNYSGIGTINTLRIGTQTNKATISYTTNTARTLTIPSLSGNRTFAFIDQDQTFSGNQNFTNINVSGISTLGNIRVSSGVVTATSGIVTYYGDGSGLINTPPGSPAGSATQVQYNNGIAFAGSPNLTHDGTVTNATNITGTYLSYSGIGTISNITGSTIDYPLADITNIFGTNLNYSGVGTITTLNSTTANLTNISGTNISGTNISGTNINLSGIITSTSYVVSGGTSSEFLKADGSVDSSTYTSTGKAIAMAIVFG